MGPINYIVYISKEAFLFNENTLSNILVESRERNKAHKITGILLFNSGDIMQVIEGPEAEVQHIFEKIRSDKRHKEVVKIADDYVDQRSFGDWSMAFRTATPEIFLQVCGYTGLSEQVLPEENSSSHSVLFLLKTFLAIHPSMDNPAYGR